MEKAGFILKLPRARARKANHERVRQTKIHEPYGRTPAKGRVEPTIEDGLRDWSYDDNGWEDPGPYPGEEDRDEAQ